jgi:hypothetical protein
MREKDARRAALAKRDAAAAVIGAGDFIGSAIAGGWYICNNPLDPRFYLYCLD